MNLFRIALALVFLITLNSCVRAPIKDPKNALRITKPKDWKDDLNFEGLSKTIELTILKLEENPNQIMNFPNREISQDAYAKALKNLSNQKSTSEFLEYLKNNFDVFEVYGNDQGWSKVFVTSYYSPIFRGSLRKTKEFTEPVYAKPKDLVRMPLDPFIKLFPQVQDSSLVYLTSDKILRGQLIDGETGGKEFIPYKSRAEIHDWNKKKSPKILCYLDPVDLFFLQIQGSGKIDLGNGKNINLVYAEQNGHPYFAIGKALNSQIPMEEMSLQRIRSYLRSVDALEQKRLMDLNPSYIFFDKSKEPSLTAFGVSAQSGRSIATDRRYFAKGALAFLYYPSVEAYTEGGGRFVLDHDIGGAIRGPGRVDLFWGEGNQAEEVSGRMRGEGQLFYFIPKADAEPRNGK